MSLGVAYVIYRPEVVQVLKSNTFRQGKNVELFSIRCDMANIHDISQNLQTYVTYLKTS